MRTYGKRTDYPGIFRPAIICALAFMIAFVPSGRIAAEGTVRHLDVEQETTELGPRYVLTIDGNTLKGDQTVNSAVRFFEDAGIPMEYIGQDENNDALYWGENEVFLFDTIAVNNGLYLRKAANTTTLVGIQFHLVLAREDETEKVIQSAQDAYQVLKSRLGSPTECIWVYQEGGRSDAGTEDLSKAITEKLIPLTKTTDFAFLSVEFDNLVLDIAWHGEFYIVGISLAPYGQFKIDADPADG